MTQPTVRNFAQLIPALDTPTIATSTAKTLEQSLLTEAGDIKQLEQRNSDTGSGTDGTYFLPSAADALHGMLSGSELHICPEPGHESVVPLFPDYATIIGRTVQRGQQSTQGQ